jgi:hypothetical protein
MNPVHPVYAGPGVSLSEDSEIPDAMQPDAAGLVGIPDSRFLRLLPRLQTSENWPSVVGKTFVAALRGPIRPACG